MKEDLWMKGRSGICEIFYRDQNNLIYLNRIKKKTVKIKKSQNEEFIRSIIR